ncbi:MAG: phenylacetate--CoA ligase family protein [Chitinophagaceae bacterium]|nr:phenylacetate--CoA ligase family protein [Chitinophagaceae bacterium]
MAKFLERFRAGAFWIQDAMKGSPVRRHYADIAMLLESNIDVTDRIKQQKLAALLKHATATTPFYQQYNGQVTLHHFPVINKTLIRENFEAFSSSAFTKEQQVPTVTSGSTGTPFKVLHHADKKKRNSADTMYFAQRAGYTVGDRLLYMKIWSANNKKARLQGWMQNMVPVDVITFNDAAIEKLLKQMESDDSTFAFLGYSSALELICRYLDKKNSGKVKATLSSAISMSETLNDYTKKTIEKYFGVPVYSRYSNLENGILAQQVPGSEHTYLVNTASYVLEIFKMDEDVPAAAGELGRIVVTDLYNYAMPLIRYDTGDIGRLSPGKDKAGNSYLETVEGRKLDLLFATDGSLVSSYIVYKNMWQYTEILQYQLVQYGAKDYVFKINMDGAFTKEEKLVQEFKQYLGQDANFTVEYVDEIPLLSSGKRKKIANTYHNQ